MSTQEHELIIHENMGIGSMSKTSFQRWQICLMLTRLNRLSVNNYCFRATITNVISLILCTVFLHFSSAKGQPIDTVGLTSAEIAWLAEHPKLRMAVDIAWAPFEFVDENGRYRGMAADYVRLIEDRLGIEIEVDTERPWPEMVNAVKNRDLDAFSLVVRTPQRDEYVNFTKPYISFPMVIVTLDTEPYVDGLQALSTRPIAVVKSYASHELLQSNHPELNLHLASDVRQGLELVSNGKAYAFVGNLAVVSQAIREAGVTNLKVSGQTPYRFDLSMAVRNDWPMLVPILQKALDSISHEERDRIYNQWIRVKFEEEVDYRLVLAGIAFAALIVITILGWNRKLQHEIVQRQAAESALTARALELEAAHDKMEHMAYFDALTGLANRAHCQKDLAEKVGSAGPDTKFAIIQIDLDNFKRVNDTLGHDAGDQLLREVGNRLSLLSSELPNFKAYRYGGDEFFAIVRRDDNTNLEMICAELNDLIGAALEIEDTVLYPTVSLGVAYYPEHAVNVKTLMVFADLALYRTKELGRDGFEFFSLQMKKKVDAEARIEDELRIAVEQDQLELHYQPQISINTGRITGLEALLRWRHPEHGVITPDKFLSLGENSDLALIVGRKVFDEAMTAARGWVDDGTEFGRLSINLSPQHLRRGSILDDFFGAMTKHNVEPRFLAVEFLESLILDDPNSDVAGILDQLRARGVNVELDDFGTGYASLAHLTTMPITGLKVDRSFVCRIADDSRQRSIVTALSSISKLMNLRLVCEGIETAQQLTAIARIGDCSVQGYFVVKPMNLADTTKWLKNHSSIDMLKLCPNTATASS